MQILLLLLPLVTWLNTPEKVDFSGSWVGVITQNEGGYRSKYDFEMVLVQNGDKITGRTYVTVEGIFAEMELEGEVHKGSYLRWHETKILHSRKSDGMEWCIKRGQLELKKEKDLLRLEGFWSGETTFGDCIPGKIVLKKGIPRA